MRYNAPAQFTMPGRFPVIQDILSIHRATEHTKKGVVILCRMPAVAEATERSFPNHRLGPYFYCMSFLTLGLI